MEMPLPFVRRVIRFGNRSCEGLTTFRRKEIGAARCVLGDVCTRQ